MQELRAAVADVVDLEVAQLPVAPPLLQDLLREDVVEADSNSRARLGSRGARDDRVRPLLPECLRLREGRVPRAAPLPLMKLSSCCIIRSMNVWCSCRSSSSHRWRWRLVLRRAASHPSVLS